MANSPCIFGTHPMELRPVTTAYFGQEGWFTVPRGWNCRYEGSQAVASPNANFIPKYMCEVNADGSLVFQDLLAVNPDDPRQR